VSSEDTVKKIENFLTRRNCYSTKDWHAEYIKIPTN
jgi:hypothetical protein